MQEALLKHLKTGSTTVCRTWLVTRKDGVRFGFTDHDEDLRIEGTTFSAGTGLTARAIEQTNGLAVDNTEAIGALSDVAVSEEDILAGRYDSAEVIISMVNWTDVTERSILFRGTFGDIVRSNGAFRVELRGLSEPLNVPRGRIYQKNCDAIFGDKHCKIDLAGSQAATTQELLLCKDSRILEFNVMPQYAVEWFSRGFVTVIDGAGYGQTGHVKKDHLHADKRVIELWQTLVISPKPGDQIRLIAGCDKTMATCRQKFNNLLNFRGFPHIPGDDWIRTGPSTDSAR